MSLVSCPECNRQVSTRAAACPGCGHPAGRFAGLGFSARPRTSRRAVASLLSALLVVGAGGWLWGHYAHEQAVREARETAGLPALPAAPALRGAAPESEARALEMPELVPEPAPARPEGTIELEVGRYEAAEVDALPELANRDEISELLQEVYPEALRDEAVEGTVQVRLLVAPDGSVDPGTIAVQEATDAAFAEAALPVVRRMRFRPASIGGVPVSVWVSLPILFEIDESGLDDPPPAPPTVTAER